MDETLTLSGQVESVHCVNTGVPHAVVVVSDVKAVAIEAIGSLIRYHKQYAPDGINANFIQQRDKKTVAIRTYERGVEAETLACGTGAVAGALVASHVFGFKSPVRVMTHSGLPLAVSFTKNGNGYKDVFLKGDARVIYKAYLQKDALLMMDDVENPSPGKMVNPQSAPVTT
jgi:diaminopimelate epimerase